MKTQNKTFLKITTALACCMLVASVACANKSPQKLFLWKATKGKSSVYLLGSVHVGKKDLYPLDPAILSAYKSSKTMAVEADVLANPLQNLAIVKATSEYKKDDSLPKHISKKTYAELRAWYKNNRGGYFKPFDKLKPWYHWQAVIMARIMEGGYSQMYGIDLHFEMKAKRSGKKIRELETVQFQLNMLSGFSDDIQEALLSSALDKNVPVAKEMDELFEIWKNGDDAGMANAINKEIKREPKLRAFYDKLTLERNIGMAKKVESYLDNGGDCFVIVGAAHLSGKGSVIELLKKEGVSVEQISATASNEQSTPENSSDTKQKMITLPWKSASYKKWRENQLTKPNTSKNVKMTEFTLMKLQRKGSVKRWSESHKIHMQGLISIINIPAEDADKSNRELLNAKIKAVELLGIHRAEEAISALYANLEKIRQPTGNAQNEIEQKPIYPCGVALTRIGKRSVITGIEELMKDMPDSKRRQIIIIIRSVEGDAAAKFILENALGKAKDETEKTNLQKSLELSKKIGGWKSPVNYRKPVAAE